MKRFDSNLFYVCSTTCCHVQHKDGNIDTVAKEQGDYRETTLKLKIQSLFKVTLLYFGAVC